jgi:hypothetical protein
LKLERTLSDLVNQAFAFTPAETCPVANHPAPHAHSSTQAVITPVESQRDSATGELRHATPTPTGLCPPRFVPGRNPVGVDLSRTHFPRVARGSQPWAGGHNPVGIARQHYRARPRSRRRRCVNSARSATSPTRPTPCPQRRLISCGRPPLPACPSRRLQHNRVCLVLDKQLSTTSGKGAEHSSSTVQRLVEKLCADPYWKRNGVKCPQGQFMNWA